MYRILGSWIKRREQARVGLVPWNFFLRLCLRAPSLNNAVYVISVSQALITTARLKQKIGYVGFIVFFVLIFDSVFFFETASPQMRVDFITEVIWIVIMIQQKVLDVVTVPNLAPSTLPTILHQNRVGRVLGTRFGRYLAITCFISLL